MSESNRSAGGQYDRMSVHGKRRRGERAHVETEVGREQASAELMGAAYRREESSKKKKCSSDPLQR